MERIDYEAKIQALEKTNRILTKKLERAEAHHLELDESNQRKEALLQQILQEVKDSQQQLADLNEDLEQRVEQRTTELKQALSNLQQMQLQLVQNEKMSALGNLVAGVAHEINNPIGFISGNLSAIKPAIEDLIAHLNLYRAIFSQPGIEIQADAEAIELEYLLEDVPKMIASMQVGCDRIKTISTSLRTFSRADTVEKVEANIHEGIDSALMILQHRMKATDQRPQIEVVKHYGNLPQVRCFLGQLNQVFMNVLANAIDAIEDFHQNYSVKTSDVHSNRITIRTSTTEDCQHLAIQIQDTGLGMSDAVKQKVFDHLFTTKGVGEGTGLGLAIARQIIVEKHGGTINVNSVLGHGAEFTMTIPIKAEAEHWSINHLSLV